MKKQTLIFILAILLTAILSTIANAVVPNDRDYFYFERGNYQYIFPEEHKDLAFKISLLNEEITNLYEQDFNWHLDGQTSMVLTSSKNQIANAYATILPFNLTTFFGGGIELIDNFAEKSWVTGLLTHETAHLYQLNIKRGLAQTAHSLFGNQPFIWPFMNLPFFWIFPSPNMLLPKLIIEGNAVLHESRFGNGGRLYSGEENALFFATLRSDIMDKTGMINSQLEFPYDHGKYLFGGHFFLYLASKYSVQKVDEIFYHHGDNYINPLILNDAIIKALGLDLYELLNDFLTEKKMQAMEQKYISSDTAILATTISYSPMNKVNGQILVMANNDGRSPLQLLTYNITDSSVVKKEIDLPDGKVFIVDGRPVTATASYIGKNNTIEYSLWEDGMIPLPAFNSKAVQDLKGQKLLYVDVPTSFDTYHLYLNDKLIGETNSSALLDENENAYYFKQEGNTRSLFKNDTTLFSYDGYYGKLVEITNDNIFFIASSKLGSSLFRYSFATKKITRELPFDTIVDAKVIATNKFIVTEVTASGYEYKVVNSSEESIAETPFYQQLSIDTNQLETLNKKITSQDNPPEIKKYSPLGNLRFQGWNLSTVLSNKNALSFAIASAWTDPLGQNIVSLNLNRDSIDENNSANATYYNSKYLLHWGVASTFENNYSNTNTNDLLFSLLADLPFFQRGNIGASINSKASINALDSEDRNWIISTSIFKTKSYPLSLFPYRDIKLTLGAEQVDKIEQKYFAAGHLIYDLYKENIFSLDFELQKSNQDITETGYYENTIPHNEYSIFNPEANNLFLRTGVMYQLVINQGIYFTKFPIGLRRIIPSIFTCGYFVNPLAKSYNIFTGGVGLDGEFLIAHNFPALLGVKLTREYSLNNELYGELTFKTSF